MNDSKISKIPIPPIPDEIRLLPRQFDDLHETVKNIQSSVIEISKSVTAIERDQKNSEKSVDKLCDVIDKWKDEIEERVEWLRDDNIRQKGGISILSKVTLFVISIGGLIISIITAFK